MNVYEQAIEALSEFQDIYSDHFIAGIKDERVVTHLVGVLLDEAMRNERQPIEDGYRRRTPLGIVDCLLTDLYSRHDRIPNRRYKAINSKAIATLEDIRVIFEERITVIYNV